MLESDEVLIRRPILTGHQQIEGLWFSFERFDEFERVRLIIDQWQTGASVYRFAEGDLVRFCQPVSVQCEMLVGWPLVRQGRALCSALLDPEEMRSLPAADVWLGDSLGEMALYYGLAHVAMLGGSFAPLGGQNLIEAAACGCPVVLGPHTFNFAEAAELACAAGAAQRVPDMAAGMALAAHLATDAPEQAAASERASRFATAHRGAARATVQAILEIVQTDSR